MKKYLIKIFEFTKRVRRHLYRRFVAPRIPVNPDGKIYVNVGCGLDSGREFINIDVLTLPNIHHIHDITDLGMLRDNSVDLLYASHVVEHLPRPKLLPTLKEWRRVLKSGGIFRFSVPDFDNLIKVYEDSGNVETIRDQVLGQNPPYNNHHTLWNYDQAVKVLTTANFTNVRRWSPDAVEHHDFKDRSGRTLSVSNGEVPLSLNIEATKP